MDEGAGHRGWYYPDFKLYPSEILDDFEMTLLEWTFGPLFGTHIKNLGKFSVLTRMLR